MRIIAGTYRGRALKTPQGDDTRPTSDRVREALMSSLYSLRGSFDTARVLDAFAGSGACGLECLSRGAAFALFCEQNRQALRVIEQNIAALSVPRENYQIRKGDTFTLPSLRMQPFNLLFFDPPYAYDASAIVGLISALDKAHLIEDKALLVYEFAKKDTNSVFSVVDALEYERVSVKNYGHTSLITLRKD